MSFRTGNSALRQLAFAMCRRDALIYEGSAFLIFLDLQLKSEVSDLRRQL
jgi:hypothetical protein